MSMTSHLKSETAIGQFLLNSVEVPYLCYQASSYGPRIRHGGKRWPLIGTAFDYLVRMSMSRTLNLEFNPKIAAHAIDMYRKGPMRNGEDFEIREFRDSRHKKKFQKCCSRAANAIEVGDFREMALASLSFARLDPYLRSFRWDESWAYHETDSEDSDELIQLHDLWKTRFAVPEGEVRMNPAFLSGGLVGGADADLIVNRTIIDWKVVNEPRRDLKKNLAQLVGYSILSHIDGVRIDTVSLYFARHGVTMSTDLSGILSDSIENTVARFKEVAETNRAVLQ